MNTYGSGEEIYRRRIQYPTLLLPTINSTAYNIGGGGGYYTAQYYTGCACSRNAALCQ